MGLSEFHGVRNETSAGVAHGDSHRDMSPVGR
jgi:hypothetical protein